MRQSWHPLRFRIFVSIPIFTYDSLRCTISMPPFLILNNILVSSDKYLNASIRVFSNFTGVEFLRMLKTGMSISLTIARMSSLALDAALKRSLGSWNFSFTFRKYVCLIYLQIVGSYLRKSVANLLLIKQ